MSPAPEGTEGERIGKDNVGYNASEENDNPPVTNVVSSWTTTQRNFVLLKHGIWLASLTQSAGNKKLRREAFESFRREPRECIRKWGRKINLLPGKHLTIERRTENNGAFFNFYWVFFIVDILSILDWWIGLYTKWPSSEPCAKTAAFMSGECLITILYTVLPRATNRDRVRSEARYYVLFWYFLLLYRHPYTVKSLQNRIVIDSVWYCPLVVNSTHCPTYSDGARVRAR